MTDTSTADAMCVDEIFNDSYERCLKHCDFIDSFYATFIESCEVVARTLAGTNTTRQIGAVEAPLYRIMALRSMEPEDAVSHFRKFCAHPELAQEDCGPVYYDLWKKCLLETVARYDDRYDSTVEAAWREVLSGGIDIMKSV